MSSISTPALTQPQTQMRGQVLGASAYNFTRSLQRGSSGLDVAALQKTLIAAEFLKIDAPTSYFGAATESALKAFQKAHGLDPVGYTGPKTRALLNQGTAFTATSAPMTEAQRQALIQQLQAQVKSLLAQIAARTATSTEQ